MDQYKELCEFFHLLAADANMNRFLRLKSDDEVFGYIDYEEIGIAMRYDGDLSFKDHAYNINFYVKEIGGTQYILLTTTGARSWESFATVCMNFMNRGVKNSARERIKENPLSWWEEWKYLFGNTLQTKRVYDVLGELLSLRYLLEQSMNPHWDGIEKNSIHDIATPTCDYEVKSTLSKYKTEVTISSQYQLNEFEKPLKLLFCRFEESAYGHSINTLVEELVVLGENRQTIENSLEKAGLYKGRTDRSKSFKLLEMLEFNVDETFPKITHDSFLDGKMPDGVVSMSYTIDLLCIPHRAIN